MSKKTFIEAHCHLFNFTDIPLYETAMGHVEMPTTKLLLYGLFVSVSAPVSLPLAGILKIPEKKLKKKREFLQFFDRSVDENIRFLAHQIAETPEIDAERIVLIPKVMDFDCTHQECGWKCSPCTDRQCPLYSPPGEPAMPFRPQDPSAEEQMARLVEAIQKVSSSPGRLPFGREIRVHPFLGFDLRKLTPKNSSAMEDLKALWDKYGVKPEDRGKGFENLQNGKALGIKLYPPIGFNPCPDDKTASAYIPFYEWCIKNRIPLTVHCQPGSFTTVDGETKKGKSRINRDTHPKNWRKLFDKWREFGGKGDIGKLRVNFAHFVGDQQIKKDFNEDKIKPGSWLQQLLSLLCTYKNVYADVSAFDWADAEAARKFVGVLALEENEGIKPYHLPLWNKLLWGSDVPMVLSDDAFYSDKSDKVAAYKHFYGRFLKTIQGAGELTDSKKNLLIQSMTVDASMKFLGLTPGD